MCRAWPLSVVYLHWECVGKQVPYLAQEPATGGSRSVCGCPFVLRYSISHAIADSVMSVTITRYRMDIILPAFANCLQSLPNLHTLELCHVHQEMTTKLKRAFEGKTIPSIRTVVLPTIAHHILRSCPNVVDVTCNVGDGSQILGTIASKCPKVERISGATPSLSMLKRLSGPETIVAILLLTKFHQGWQRRTPTCERCPSRWYADLVRFYIDPCNELIPHLQLGVGYPDVSSLGIFKRLAVIEFQLELPEGGKPPPHHVSAATKVLRASEYTGRKVIKVRALRTRANATGWGYAYVGLENLDVVVV